jgi:hypothetical protein
MSAYSSIFHSLLSRKWQELFPEVPEKCKRNAVEFSPFLSYEDIDAALKRYQPRVVIPGHYFTRGASSVLTTLGTADEWVDSQKNVVRFKKSELILNPKKINSFKQKVYYFGMNFSRE